MKLSRLSCKRNDEVNKFMKTFVAAVGVRLLTQWLYGKCCIRNMDKVDNKEKEGLHEESADKFELFTVSKH